MNLDNFATTRRIRQGNRLAQVFLALSLAALCNYIAARDFFRADLTRERKYSLSPETQAQIENLAEPVTIIVTRPPRGSGEAQRIVYDDLDALLRQYEIAGRCPGGANRIRIERVSVFTQTRRAQEIVARYGIAREQTNTLIVVSGDQFKEVQGGLLYEVDDEGNQTFTGERALTSAIIEVSQPDKPVIYFLTGHGERRPDDVDPVTGFSQATDFLLRRNWDIRQLDLNETPQVPEDAALLIIAAPQVPLLPREVSAVSTYLRERRGRVIAMIEPGTKTGMDVLFDDWGLLLPDHVVIEPAAGAITPQGEMVVRRYADHPILEYLIREKISCQFGYSRPVVENLGSAPDATRKLTFLLFTSDQSWGELSYRNAETVQMDPQEDLSGPLPIAAVSDRSGETATGLAPTGGRLVVFGSASFASNGMYNTLGNFLLFKNTVEWIAERDARMLNIPPRRWKPVDLAVTEAQITGLWLNLLYLPGAVAAIGILIAILRRR